MWSANSGSINLMSKVRLTKPILICFYGFPGSGKSFVSRNLSESLPIAQVSADRIRGELFASPRYDAQENAIVVHLMDYMANEFLSAGVSVAYDINATRQAGRRKLREMAAKNKAEYLLVWLQIDQDSAFGRTQKRDRRTSDDRFTEPQTQMSFEKQVGTMQNPKDEPYLVISGKHAFATQKGAVVNRLYQLGIVASDTVQENIAKPELINLVPNPILSSLENDRRNISIS